jgi:multicomponent Na+:H+ antiporter subunit A
MVAGAVVVVLARTRLFAVAALGVVGYGVAVVFLLFGGPDLAITQFAIETLSVLLFALVLRRLPELRVLSPRASGSGTGWSPSSGGAFVTALVLAATAAPHPTAAARVLAASSLALANGRNVVNVILVDFRALRHPGRDHRARPGRARGVALLKLRGSSRRGEAV